MAVLKKKTKKKKLTEEEKIQRKQERDIRSLMQNIGFSKVARVDRKEFIFKDRKSELDDIFIYENIILLTEYTIGSPGTHLLKKDHFYKRVLENPREFLEFIYTTNIYPDFNQKIDKLKEKFSMKHFQVRIVYCSMQTISKEHKQTVSNITFFDYHIVKYFESLSKIIKKSSRHEFFDFLGIPFNLIGKTILESGDESTKKFSGHILPEEHSSFKEGYKIVSFYIDAENLLKRSYVLRQNGWRDKQNIGHYQRMFISSKIKSMRKYLYEKERVFINNIIATLSIDKIKLYDEKNNYIEIDEKGDILNQASTKVTPTKIEILDETNIIGVIDGQHRTYAYHEGDDLYEKTISKKRGIQNLLVTGILFPKNEDKNKKLKFEAGLFMEINATQSGASSLLKQEIELMVNPFSSTAISKQVLSKLNESGPLSNLLEEYWYEKGKIKTSSIVSFGLKPLLKLDDSVGSDSLYSIWDNKDKSKIKDKKSEEFLLLNEYIDFSVSKIREILIAFSSILGKDKWKIDRNDKSAILTVTTINGILNALRLSIENKKVLDIDGYKKALSDIDKFNFKSYSSSQYRKMGHKLYSDFLNNI